MGLVGFIKLGFNCFDLLAWPFFGMGFPLYASVRAIENNSNPEMRNLVAYWILFSLVSLFELAFMRLIDWLPFWPYLKLMAVCLLELPNFNGASYVYECLLHPCLSLDLRAAIKYFIKPKEDKNLNTESFLAALDRYVQENGSEALEKLVDRRSKHKKPDIGVGVTKAMTYTEEKETAAAIQSKYEKPDVGKVDARAAELPEKSPVSVTKLSKVKEPHVEKENANAGEVKDESPAIATEQEARLATAKLNLKSPRWQVKCVETNLVQNEKKTVAAGENQEKTVAAVGGESKAVEIIDSKKVQREWKLKASKQVNGSEGFSSLFQSKHTKPDIAAEEIKAITNTGEMETGAAIQSKYEEPDIGKLDARAVGLPEESPGAATKLSNVKEPHVFKENDNVGELKDEIPAVATGEEAKSATTQSGDNSLLPVKCVEPNLTQYEKNTVADEAIKEKIVAAPDGEGNKAMKITNSEKVQSEWTCALCQVTATCEKTRNSHLQGRKHKAQELKASKQANNNTDEGGKETANNDGPKNSSQPRYTTVVAGNLAPEARNKETVNNDGPKNSSQPQYTTVFAGNLAPEVSQLDLHRHFHTLGAGVIEEVRVQRDKGFGFVRYSTHAEAALAIRMGNTCSMLFGKQIKCSWGSKPTPPGTSSNPLPPPVAARPAPMPWFSAGDVLAYEWQLAMAKMGGGDHPLMHPQGQQHHLLEQAAMGMDSAGASQVIYDGGFQNVAAAQQLMYYQ